MLIRVPPLGESITEATISRWLRREGDAVNIGDTLVELETDKITVEVPAASAGVLTRRARLEGDVVKVEEVLGELDASAVGAAPLATIPAAAVPLAAPAPAASAAPNTSVRAAPSAARLAVESGVDLSRVAGTGRGGVVSKPDVIAALSAPVAALLDEATIPRIARICHNHVKEWTPLCTAAGKSNHYHNLVTF